MINDTNSQSSAVMDGQRAKQWIDLRQILVGISAGAVVGVINLAFTLSIAARGSQRRAGMFVLTISLLPLERDK